MFKIPEKTNSSQQHIEKKNYELVHFLELGTLFKMLNYERLTELIHFKICELNFELVHVESELSQHCV
jgi:hypothetical protein